MPHTEVPSWRAAVRLGLLVGAGAPSELSCFHHGDSVQVNFLISTWWKERESGTFFSPTGFNLESIIADPLPTSSITWIIG